MTEKDTWNLVGIFYLLACLGLFLGIWHYSEGNVFEASLYFVLVVVALSVSLIVLIADRWYQERKSALKVVVVALFSVIIIVFVLIHIQYVGDPTLALMVGIIIGSLIGLVAFVLILKHRIKQ
jgi:hypothetical protein